MALQLPAHRAYAGYPDAMVVQGATLSMSAPFFFRWIDGTRCDCILQYGARSGGDLIIGISNSKTD